MDTKIITKAYDQFDFSLMRNDAIKAFKDVDKEYVLFIDDSWAIECNSNVLSCLKNYDLFTCNLEVDGYIGKTCRIFRTNCKFIGAVSEKVESKDKTCTFLSSVKFIDTHTDRKRSLLRPIELQSGLSSNDYYKGLHSLVLGDKSGAQSHFKELFLKVSEDKELRFLALMYLFEIDGIQAHLKQAVVECPNRSAEAYYKMFQLEQNPYEKSRLMNLVIQSAKQWNPSESHYPCNHIFYNKFKSQ